MMHRPAVEASLSAVLDPAERLPVVLLAAAPALIEASLYDVLGGRNRVARDSLSDPPDGGILTYPTSAGMIDGVVSSPAMKASPLTDWMLLAPPQFGDSGGKSEWAVAWDTATSTLPRPIRLVTWT